MSTRTMDEIKTLLHHQLDSVQGDSEICLAVSQNNKYLATLAMKSDKLNIVMYHIGFSQVELGRHQLRVELHSPSLRPEETSKDRVVQFFGFVSNDGRRMLVWFGNFFLCRCFVIEDSATNFIDLHPYDRFQSHPQSPIVSNGGELVSLAWKRIMHRGAINEIIIDVYCTRTWKKVHSWNFDCSGYGLMVQYRLWRSSLSRIDSPVYCALWSDVNLGVPLVCSTKRQFYAYMTGDV